MDIASLAAAPQESDEVRDRERASACLHQSLAIPLFPNAAPVRAADRNNPSALMLTSSKAC
jgi:hypothetical protein